MPAEAGDDEEVVLRGVVAADLAVGGAEAFGADSGGFGEDFLEVAFAEGEGAEGGQGGLLAKKFGDFVCGYYFIAIN